MLANRVINPRYPSSAARMADGRLFTDYRGNCQLFTNTDFDTKQRFMTNGTLQMQNDRTLLTMVAASTGCVDTMVPELTKRVCDWSGCQTLPSQPAGLGQGRLYLPGRKDLAAGDPDVLAAATFPMPGTFSANANPYFMDTGLVARSGHIGVPARPNKYSAPYG